MNLGDLFDDLTDAGGEILDAVRREDYSDLSRSISDTVADAVEGLRREAASMQAGTRDPMNGSPTGRGYGDVRSGSGIYAGRPRRERAKKKADPFMKKAVSRQSGLAEEIVGGLAVFMGASIVLFFGAAGLVFGGSALPAAIVGGIAAAGGVFGIWKGHKKNRLVKQFYEYGRIIGPAEFYSIADLARECGQTREEVLANLKEMESEGMLPPVWYDQARTTLILTEELYHQAQAAESARLEREAADRAADAAYEGVSEDVRKILEEGKAYRRTIHRCNEEIPDPEMTAKLARLEEIMDKIFDQVRQKPESAPRLRRLMSYYLPTTTKLLMAYIELDKQPEAGENITKTKREIEEALDTINDAFEALLDTLFQDMAWDISSDISVMKTMMSQDGLVEEES